MEGRRYVADITAVGPLPDAPWCSSRDDAVSGTRLFRVPDDYVARSVLQFAGEKDRAGEIVQFHHRFVVAPPSVHSSGQIYRWILGGPFPAVDDLPWLTEPWLEGLRATGGGGNGGGCPRPRNLRVRFRHRARLRSLRYLPTREIERRISARVAALAEMLPETGRNDELWELACRFGELVAADRVSEDDAFDELLAACDQNGLIADEGQWKVEDTIGRGLERGAEG